MYYSYNLFKYVSAKRLPFEIVKDIAESCRTHSNCNCKLVAVQVEVLIEFDSKIERQ